MREQESHYTVRADYLSSSDATNAVITPQDRHDICSWSYKVTDMYSIDRSAAVIGMSYLDRFMCTSSPGAKAALLSRTEYQLAAVACLAIALKCRSGIKVGTDFVSRDVCQGLYDADELEGMEVEILGALTFAGLRSGTGGLCTEEVVHVDDTFIVSIPSCVPHLRRRSGRHAEEPRR